MHHPWSLTVLDQSGISLKTQELYLAVYCLRYLDLFTTFYNRYVLVMKILFLAISVFTIWIMQRWERVRDTYRREQDNVAHWSRLFLPSALVALVVSLFGQGLPVITLIELAWTLSICLEAVAMVPQILMFRRYRQVENLTGGAFIVMMGVYRLLYIFNWIYRSQTERSYNPRFLVYACAVVQVTLSLGGFFYGGQLCDGEQAQSAALWPQLKQVLASLCSMGPPVMLPADSSNDDGDTGTLSLAELEHSSANRSEDQSKEEQDPLTEPLLIV